MNGKLGVKILGSFEFQQFYCLNDFPKIYIFLLFSDEKEKFSIFKFPFNKTIQDDFSFYYDANVKKIYALCFGNDIVLNFEGFAMWEANV